ncbi:MAG: hypothetical protein KC776_25420 [Myxococcales bacterium]|nr:hypothetical protein [Myxococcales bacterium]MCB9581779.1 hypothetical protein [Polyangiaceae bacterium]
MRTLRTLSCTTLTLAVAACSPTRDPVADHPIVALRSSVADPIAAPPSSAADHAAAPPAVTPLPYDLAADLNARRQGVREELGPDVHTEVAHGVFLLVTPRRGALAGAVSVTNRALDAYFNGRFDTPPKKAISVLLYPDATGYRAWCLRHWNEPCHTPYGFYLPTERAIVMNVAPGIGTLTHELVHPLVEADFPEAPDWIDEGIASLFERFSLPRAGEIHGGKNWRHPRLINAWRSPKERDAAQLPALFGMSDATFRGAREDLHYAMARYLCQWLDAQGKLWPFYHRFRDDFATDPTGRSAFAAVVGMSPEEAHPAWQRWVRGL